MAALNKHAASSPIDADADWASAPAKLKKANGSAKWRQFGSVPLPTFAAVAVIKK